MRKAISASRILRSKVCSDESRKFLATCWVMVEAPCFLPLEALVRIARTMPSGSMPPCL